MGNPYARAFVPSVFLTARGWAKPAGLVSGQEKDAILCKIKPTLSVASSTLSSKEPVTLGLDALEELEGLGRLGTTWTTWGPGRISNWRLWAGERGTGEQLISGTELELCERVGEHGECEKGWWKGCDGMSEELSRLLREAEGLAAVDGGLIRFRRPNMLLGGGFGGLGLTESPSALVGEVVETLLTKLSRSKGNLLRRGVSLGLG